MDEERDRRVERLRAFNEARKASQAGSNSPRQPTNRQFAKPPSPSSRPGTAPQFPPRGSSAQQQQQQNSHHSHNHHRREQSTGHESPRRRARDPADIARSRTRPPASSGTDPVAPVRRIPPEVPTTPPMRSRPAPQDISARVKSPADRPRQPPTIPSPRPSGLSRPDMRAEHSSSSLPDAVRTRSPQDPVQPPPAPRRQGSSNVVVATPRRQVRDQSQAVATGNHGNIKPYFSSESALDSPMRQSPVTENPATGDVAAATPVFKATFFRDVVTADPALVTVSTPDLSTSQSTPQRDQLAVPSAVAQRLQNNPARQSYVPKNIVAEYRPISTDYQRRLVEMLYSLSAGRDVAPPTKADFLTEEGYYNYLEDGEKRGEDMRFEQLVAEMVRLWDVTYPLLSEDHLLLDLKKTGSVRSKPELQTTVNLVIRVMEARGISGGKDGTRNCSAAIEYPAGASTGDRKRYDTQTCPNSLTPSWDQQVTLTIHSLEHSMLVTLFDQREKHRFFGGDEIKEDFMGCIKIDVGELVSETAKNGFMDRWYKLNASDASRDKYRKMDVSGEIRIEVEMAGIMDTDEGDDNPDWDTSKAGVEELRKLKKLQHRLIKYKVNLKSLFNCLLKAVVTLDLTVKGGSKISELATDQLRWNLTRDGDTTLKQFSLIWVISAAFRKMAYLDSIFDRYKEEKVHALSLVAAYKSLNEGIFKRNTVWLPNYEQPILLDLLSRVELHLTGQIQKYKEYFPAPRDLKNKVALKYISSSLDAILYLCCSIDKNPFFEAKHGKKGAAAATAHDESEPRLGITDYDYNREGRFSFREKLRGIFQTRAVATFQHLSELASPLNTSENVEALVVKCTHLAHLLFDEIEQERIVYQPAFVKELDILPIAIEKFINLFCLEMENMCEVVRQKRAGALMEEGLVEEPNVANGDNTDADQDDDGKPNGKDALGIKLPRTEEELLSVALDLMGQVEAMSAMWAEYAPNVSTSFNPVDWFTPFIIRWLDLTERRNMEWVDRCIEVDEFKPTNTSGFTSSSVTDLFTALFESLGFLKKAIAGFKSKPIYHAMLMSKFAQISYTAVQRYCDKVESKTESDPIGQEENRSVSAADISQHVTNTVWKLFGASTSTTQVSTPTANNAQDVEPPITCVAISNLEQMTTRWKQLFKEMHGSENQDICTKWLVAKSEKFHVENPARDRESVTGVLRVGIYQAENLKPRSNGLYNGKTSPYFVVRHARPGATSLSGTAEIVTPPNGANGVTMNSVNDPNTMEGCRTGAIPDSLNPQYQVLNPAVLARLAKSKNSSGGANNKYRFLAEPIEYIFAVENIRSLEITAIHQADSNAFTSFITSSSDVQLAQGNLPLKRSRLVSSKRTFHWVELEPQGRVLISIDMPIEGVPMMNSEDTTTSTLSFGMGGVQHMSYWFMKIDSAIRACREALVLRISQKVYTTLKPKWLNIVKEAAVVVPTASPASQHRQVATVNTHVTDTEADTALTEVTDMLNFQLNVLSSSLSDRMAQHVIYLIWLRAILFPVLQHLAPTSFYSDTNILAKPLDQRQASMLARCVSLLTAFFHADGQDLGLPLDILKNASYWFEEITVLQTYYNEPVDQLARRLGRGDISGMWALVRLLRLRAYAQQLPDGMESTIEKLLARRLALLKRGELIL